MKVSPEGICEIAEHEGIVIAPYLDSVGVWTWGVGHTAAAGGLNPATMNKAVPTNVEGAVQEALKVFAEDLKKYEARVNQAIKVPLKQHQFDALVSFDFNTGGIFKANLTKSINAGDFNKAAEQFMGWLKPVEIRKRRSAEKALFQTGNYNANGDRIPVYGTNGKGKLTGVLTVMSGQQVLKSMGTVSKVAPSETSGFAAVILDILKKVSVK